MTNEEFRESYLKHAWVTSKEAAKRAEQIQRQKEYNHQYYLEKVKKEREAQRHSVQNAQQAVRPRETPQQKDMTKYVDDYMKSHPNADRKSVEDAYRARYLSNWFNTKAEDDILAIRNKRASDLGKAQAEQQRASQSARERDSGNKRIVKQGTDAARKKTSGLSQGEQQKASQLARERDARSRSTETAKQKSTESARSRQAVSRRNRLASEAQADSARKRNMSKQKQRTNAELARRSNAQNVSYANARRKQRDYNRSIEGRVNRVLSRAMKKTSDTINKGTSAYNAAVTAVNNFINNPRKKKNRTKRNAQNLYKKYFG